MWFSRWRRPKFVHPISPPPRTAVLLPLFRESRGVASFDESEQERLALWKPQAIAASLAQLLRITAEPTHAVIVLTRPGEFLAGGERDRLWERFHIPIFEQVIDRDGTLLAYECEGHYALHVAGDAGAALLGTVRREHCPCGKEADLLFPEPGQCTLTVTRSESVCPPSPVATT
jgi:hypothetical protein